jgi:restriction system protein
MAIPDFQAIMLPILETLQDGQVRSTGAMTDLLAERFKLTDQERQELMQSGQPVFYNRVAWAKTHLKNAGLIDNPTRGKVSISEAGLKVLGQKPAIVNCRFLKQFPSYLKFIGQAPDDDKVDGKDETALETTKTPEEALEASYQLLRNTLAVEVLDHVKRCSPSFFERLVVELLVAMGYGGSFAEAARVVGQAGDGGIDGIINEDKLGLDVVCVQAKRWENAVGRPDVQKFAGSMEGLRARKGVMLTTSTFSKDAEQFVKSIERKIILINGQRLAQLMIEHNIGVAPTRSYVLKKLDQDYFEDEEG